MGHAQAGAPFGRRGGAGRLRGLRIGARSHRQQRILRRKSDQNGYRSRVIADKADRTVVKVVQSLATAVFLPVK
jgi:hypothetical protein